MAVTNTTVPLATIPARGLGEVEPSFVSPPDGLLADDMYRP